MAKIRKTHSNSIKFKAAFAMMKNEKTVSEISKEYGVTQSVLYRWKQTLQEGGPSLFSDKRSSQDTSSKDLLERKIGQLVIENDFLKKALGQ